MRPHLKGGKIKKDNNNKNFKRRTKGGREREKEREEYIEKKKETIAYHKRESNPRAKCNSMDTYLSMGAICKATATGF